MTSGTTTGNPSLPQNDNASERAARAQQLAQTQTEYTYTYDTVVAPLGVATVVPKGENVALVLAGTAVLKVLDLVSNVLAKATKVEAHLVDVPGKHNAEAGLATLHNYVLVEGLDAPGFEIGSGQSTFEAEISNLPDDVRTYGDADLLQRWQAAGGKFTIVGFKGGDATSSFDASGTLGLDDGGRVEGQLKLHSRGVVERLGPLFPEQYRGWIVGTPAEDGSYSQVLNIAAGVVFSGVVPMGMIPPAY